MKKMKQTKMKQTDSRGQAITRPPDGIYAFHPEDLILAKVNPLFLSFIDI
jgi:hypothetical protein